MSHPIANPVPAQKMQPPPSPALSPQATKNTPAKAAPADATGSDTEAIATKAIRQFKQQHSSNTPSIIALLQSYGAEGKGDRDLFLALLTAKRVEDEVSFCFGF